MNHNTQEQDNCIKDCLTCFKICTACITHCLKLGGEHSKESHINLMLSCADICEVTAKLVARQCKSCNSNSKILAICSDICNKCAASCEEISSEDPMMKECVKACRKCEETCGNEAQ